MEEFALVEADFQQYYRLDVAKLRFTRYARLFAELPPESRIMRLIAPAGTWKWQDETLSRILFEVESLNTMTYNMNRKKGSKPAKSPEQFQPEDIAKAKKEFIDQQKEQSRISADEQRNFWENRNPDTKKLP